MDTAWFGVKVFFGLVIGAVLLCVVLAIIAGLFTFGEHLLELLAASPKKSRSIEPQTPAQTQKWRCEDCGGGVEDDAGTLWHGMIRINGVCRKCQEYRTIRIWPTKDTAAPPR
jgi:hypothetical protein